MILLKNMSGDTLDLNDLGMGISWARNEQASAAFKNRTQKIPGADSDWFFGADFGSTTVPLELVTANMDLEKLDQTLDILNKFFFDSYGRPVKLKVYFDYNVANGTVYRFVRLNQALDVSYGASFHTIRIVFNLIDRYKYSENATTLNQVLVSPSGTMSPTVLGLVVPPKIMLTGSGTNVVLTSAGKSIAIGTFTEATFEIDTERYSVKKNSVETMVKIPGGFVLEPDQDFSATGTEMSINVTLQWRDRYI